MLQEESLMLRQPCTVPLLEEVPFKLRHKVVRLYTRCVNDLKLRVLPSAILRFTSARVGRYRADVGCRLKRRVIYQLSGNRMD